MNKISTDINYQNNITEEKKRLQKLLNRAKKAKWEGVINDILDLAKRKQIELDY